MGTEVKFKAGDTVWCIDAENRESELTVGNPYTVVGVNLEDGFNRVAVAGSGILKGSEFFPRRFSLTPPVKAAPVPEADPSIHRPAHYTQYAIEPLEFITKNKFDFATGNVIKYVSRWKEKDGIRDLRKAIRYIEVLIEEAEAGEAK